MQKLTIQYEEKDYIDIMTKINEQLANELNIKLSQINEAVSLMDDGNTVPFISRYRKEMTGGLNDAQLREISKRLTYLRNLHKRKEEIVRLIDDRGKLTDELRLSIERASSLTEVEDLYLPYKQKRKTRASAAIENGLFGLAVYIRLQQTRNQIESEAQKYITESIPSSSDAIKGAIDIIAEELSEDADNRKWLRNKFFRTGVIETIAKTDNCGVYETYKKFSENAETLPGHRILAINRAEREDIIRVNLTVNDEEMIRYLKSRLIINPDSDSREYLEAAASDSYKRLLKPAVEREIRNQLTEKAEDQALKVFAVNLSGLLLAPPLRGKTVLGLDPGYRTGCKAAVIDKFGSVLDTGVIYPTPPHNKISESESIIMQMIIEHKVNVIAIGNGTATKETELFTANLLKNNKDNINAAGLKVEYIIVSEAGASVYSASEVAAEEFPMYDVSLRSAVSIGRRLQDPLAELVKIDPKSIGVGQYQHDLNQKKLDEVLGGVVESCVNSVGIDLNTASPSLLSYIAGISTTIAKNIAEYRKSKGAFTDRKQLLKVSKLGAKTFEQCAGFLRIPSGENILDNTSVHPESYDAAYKLLSLLGCSEDDIRNNKLSDLKLKINRMGAKKIADIISVGIPTLHDIAEELMKPGRHPGDTLPQPELRSDVMHIEDLKPNTTLTGTVRNVADFGAFVDIGVHQDGLVHISQLADRYIRHPSEAVKVGDIVKVTVLSVDIDKKRISLSMKTKGLS